MRSVIQALRTGVRKLSEYWMTREDGAGLVVVWVPGEGRWESSIAELGERRKVFKKKDLNGLRE